MKACNCTEAKEIQGYKYILKTHTNGVDTYKGIVFTPRYCPFCGYPIKNPRTITCNQIKR